MRVHRLEITAFGPFAGTEVIDFEPLNDAGIFLLTGPTGAGKTTVFDAICFGLFGAVPGARNGAKDLKSHHAEGTAVPSVTLEASMRGRRFRIHRSPAWSRPSSRARSGRVDQPAKASVEELVDGRWVTVCTRLDDVGLLVTRVLGMNREQFCQVVMLPQGLFQTFLRAGAKERHDVLESLFETRRFGRIETWLTEHRRACDREVEASQSSIRQLLARAHEVARELQPVVEPDAEPAAYPAARQLIAGCLDTTTAAAASALELATVARDELKQAQHTLDGGRDLAALQARHRAGRERLRELEALREVVATREQRIDRAQSARSLAPLLRLVDDADRALGQAEDRVHAALRHCSHSLLDEIAPARPGRIHETGTSAADGWGAARWSAVHPDAAEAAVATRRDRLARLEAMADVEAAARALAEQVSSDDAELATVRARHATCQELTASLPGLLADAEAELRFVAETAALEPAAALRLTRAEAAAVAAHEAARLDRELHDVTQRAVDARDARARAHDRWLELRERRLHGMAAELAGQLTDGVACLVCGSSRHPAPAEQSADQVTAEEEAVAQAEFTQAAQVYEDLRALEARIGSELASSLTRCESLDPVAAKAALAQTAAELEESREAGRAKLRLEQQIGVLRERRSTLKAELDELRVACALVGRRRDDHLRELKVRREQLVRELGPDTSVEQALQQLSAELESAASLAVDVQARSHWLADATQLHARLTEALSPAGFADIEELRAAHLTEAELAVASALNRGHFDEVRDATRVVEDRVLVAASAQPEPVLAGLEEAVRLAEEKRLQVGASAVALATRRDRLEELLSELDAALASWRPRLVRRDRAAAVAAMCAGTSADNVTKTRLSHYVLAARLEQVVGAANLRLSGICGGRYSLEHSMQRGVGDSRGGLGLVVCDTYTGQRRDPATLSGGETFYVSLALALGLADLVRDEIGGAELSTLFVDEGFATLDSETLDEVMDEVDSLRAGGRCVGLVSHLAELRTRIPAQLDVRPGRNGSTIAAP
ncbi:MAG: repair protein SbcC/Rad50 [Nocardioidaceae bacterium]|nr:repair protein SbcC/Rad50 [Nocardioidaceae bacterium]